MWYFMLSGVVHQIVDAADVFARVRFVVGDVVGFSVGLRGESVIVVFVVVGG